ncbi:MAG: TraB/GumN family protein, partial [Paludibacteraceae bacterium]|nr:TraB/GumN family protein [Paludibacteraceae bacterium]
MIASKKYWIIVLLFSVFSFPLSVSRAQLLYEISGNSSKQKSYLLATNRLVDMQFLDTIPNVFKCFSRCKTVLTEFAMQDYEAIAALRQAALLPDSVKLSDFYTEEQYRFIDNCLRVQVGMGLDKLCRMKPSYLTEMLRAELFKQWLGYDEQRSMETFFEAVAAERDIPVLGLDNIGETMY